MSNEAETRELQHILQNLDWADIGDSTGLRGSSTAGSLYISLHTADPGEAGDQTTSECDFTGYARVAVARSSGGFSVSGAVGSNASTVTWPACTGGTNTATHIGIGTNSTGTGHLIFSGALSSSLAISSGITPKADAGDITVTVD